MSNDYYTEQFAGQAHGLARVEQIQAEMRRVATGFAKLPDEEQLKTDSTTSAVATGGPVNYSVELPFAPDSYVDQMRIGVRFPVANTGAANIEVIGANGATLGFKPIRQIDGAPLTAGHIGANSEGLLQYSAVGSGYWTLMAGARGAVGRPGPPAGEFSINAAGNLIFTPTDGADPTDLGPSIILYKGVYSAATEYPFLSLVRAGVTLYLHIGRTATTGTAVTDTNVWARLVDLGGNDGGMLVEFRTATGGGDPGDGRMRFNSATPADVTQIYLDDLDTNGNDLSAWIDTWDDYGADPNAQLVIKGTGQNTEAVVFALTAVTDRSGYKRLVVTHVAGTTLFSNGDLVSVVPLLRGGTGTAGTPGAPGTDLPDATTSVKGKVELATNTEIDNESGTGPIVPTISGLFRAIARKVKNASTTVRGIVELATTTEAKAGSDNARAVTPAGLAARTPNASTSVRGLVELANSSETQTGTDTDRAVTPAGLTSRTATATRAGIVELADDSEIDAGTDTDRAATPAGVRRAVRTPRGFADLTFAAALTWNVKTHPNAVLTLTANLTGLTVEGDEDGGAYQMLIKQDATGGRGFNFPSSWKWTGGTADTIPQTANSETLLVIARIGSDTYAAPLLESLS